MKSLIYKGKGTQFIPGVPTRDLTPQEVENLNDETLKQCLSTGLYAEEAEEKKVNKEALNG